MAYHDLLLSDRARLQAQMALIRAMEETEYPNLYHWFHRTRVLRTLEAVFGVMCDMDNALHVSHEGKLFFAISERYLMHWWSVHHPGAPLGSTSTWHSSLILLIHCGLLKRIVASDKSIVPNFRSVYELARQKHLRVENILYVPTYTPEVLQTAEERIQLQMETTSLRSINKESIILSSGQETANQLYLDARELTWATCFILDEMTFRIGKTIEAKGFAYKDELLQGTGNALISRIRCTGRSRKNMFRRKVEHVWTQYRKTILQDSNAVYRRPTAAEKQRFGLKKDGWIITAMPEES